MALLRPYARRARVRGAFKALSRLFYGATKAPRYTIGAQRTGELEFVALFSKPSKEEPIAWSVNKKNNFFLKKIKKSNILEREAEHTPLLPL